MSGPKETVEKETAGAMKPPKPAASGETAGGIANVHARYYRELPNVELVGVAEIIKERGLSSPGGGTYRRVTSSQTTGR